MSDLNDRATFIGGSDIAAILGLSRYKTPLSVWAEKTGQIPPKEGPEALHLKLGKRLEEVVAELWMDETGKKLIRANERRVHPKYPMFAAQIDRLVINEDAVWEGKTANVWMKKDWVDDQIPQEYICQVMWQLAVSGRKLGYISCLIGNEKFVTKTIARDPVMIAEMLKRAKAFWDDFIVARVMPAQVTAADSETLYNLFPEAERDSQIDLGDEGARFVESRNALKQDLIVLEDQIERVENELKIRLGTKETGKAGKYKVTWKNQKRKGYTVKDSEFRMFNVREIKEAKNV